MHENPQNEHYQLDMQNNVQITRKISSALGLWPNIERNLSTSEKIDKTLRIFISHIILYGSLLPGWLYWIFETRVQARIRAVTILFYGIMTLIKYYTLIIREGRIKRCLKHIENDWKNVDNAGARNRMLEAMKFGKRLVTISVIFAYSSGLSLRTLMPLARGKIITPQNVTIRPLPYPTYLFSLNVQFTPVYEMVYAMHCLSGVITMSIAMIAYGFIVIFVMHICGQLKVLIDLIEGLVEEQQVGELEVKKKLATIVEYQVRIRSFLQLVENTIHHLCFVDLSGAVILLCILSYCMLMEWENRNIVAMCSFSVSFATGIVTMFLFNYAGEQLITQAEKLAITVCELEWYRLPHKEARGVILMMIMSNIPIRISAGKIFIVSIKTFGDILKTSAAYFNILRSVTS